MIARYAVSVLVIAVMVIVLATQIEDTKNRKLDTKNRKLSTTSMVELSAFAIAVISFAAWLLDPIWS
jgi:MFS-type transporter involved in bile tolerance (Atg22 family)